jgi:multidrug efflux pump subunit AcrA (membrane-fusion protein)
MTLEKSSPPEKINFRREAINHIWEKYSQYTLNGMIPSYSWGYLLFLSLVVLSLLFWGVFGSVSEYVSGEGLLISGESSIYSISAPTGAHHLKAMKIKQGSIIKVGQTIAYFNSPELSLEVTTLKDRKEYLKKFLFDYKKIYEQELQERLSLLNQQKQILERIMESEKQNIQQIQDMLNIDRSLSSKGLARNVDKRYLEQQLADAQRALENGYNQLIANTVSFNSFKDSWQERIRNLEIKAKETGHLEQPPFYGYSGKI